MEPERILFVYALPEDYTSGGCIYQNNLTEILRKRKAEVSILVIDSADVASAVLHQVVEIMRKDISVQLIFDSMALFGCVGAGVLDLLSNDLKSRSIVLVHCPFSSVITLYQEPYVARCLCQDVSIDELRDIETKAYQHFGTVLTVSEEQRQTISEVYCVDKDCIKVAAPLITEDIYRAEKLADITRNCKDGSSEKRYKLNEEQCPIINLVTVGTVGRRKNQLQVVKMLSALDQSKLRSNVCLRVVGPFEDSVVEKEFRSWSGKVCGKIRIEVMGSLKPVHCLSVVKSSDIFVFSSVQESFGMAPLEAAAMGIPVLASRVGVLPQFVPPHSLVELQGERTEEQQIVAWETALLSSIKNIKSRQEEANEIASVVKGRWGFEHFEKLVNAAIPNITHQMIPVRLEKGIPQARSKRKVLILDVDGTMYRKSSGLEMQIVRNIHRYAMEKYGLSSEEADALHSSYGSTVNGLRCTLKLSPKDQEDYYVTVFKGLDYSAIDVDAVRKNDDDVVDQTASWDWKTWLKCQKDVHVVIASNSPRYHIDDVLNKLGFDGSEWTMVLTPSLENSWVSKSEPAEYWAPMFRKLPRDSFEFHLLDDSMSNCIKALPYSIKGDIISDASPIGPAILRFLGKQQERPTWPIFPNSPPSNGAVSMPTNSSGIPVFSC